MYRPHTLCLQSATPLCVPGNTPPISLIVVPPSSPPPRTAVGYRVFLGNGRYFVSSDVGGGKMQWYGFHKEPAGGTGEPGRERWSRDMAVSPRGGLAATTLLLVAARRRHRWVGMWRAATGPELQCRAAAAASRLRLAALLCSACLYLIGFAG